MGEALFERERSFKSGDHVGVVVCVTEHGNLHAGMLYANQDDQCCVVHLGWQDHMSDVWEWDRLWAMIPDLEPERLESIAGLCELIFENYQQRQRFPYALKFLGSQFSLIDGSLILAKGAKGLTCATFILAICKSVGVDIVDEDSWPIRKDEDLIFLKSISTFAKDELFQILQDEVDSGVKRVQPHEVLAACACTNLPASFQAIRDPVLRVIEKLIDQAL